MSRDLTSDFIAAITAAGLAPVMLIRAYFDSGTLNLWNGLGPLTYGGNLYTGVTPILNVDTILEQKTTAATGVNISLSGLDSTILSLAENEPYQQRAIEIYIGMLDSSGAIIADPYLMFQGYMDTMTIADDGQSINIAVACESELIALERALQSTYTPENQKIEFPDDSFFDFVANIQDQTVQWG